MDNEYKRNERKPENQQNVVVNQPRHEEQKQNKSKGWIVGILAILAIVLIAGMLFLNNSDVGDDMSTMPTEENVQKDNSDVNVEAPDVNVDVPEIDTEGIEQSIEEGAETIAQ